MSVGSLPVLINNVKSMKSWIFTKIYSEWDKGNRSKNHRCQRRSGNHSLMGWIS